MFELRVPTEKDLPQLVQLAHEESLEVGRPATTTEQEILRDWNSPGQDPERSTRVVEMDGEVVATADLWFEPPMAWAGAFVSEGKRRMGIGSAIRDWMLEVLAQPHNLEYVLAGHSSINPDGAAFVSKLEGFRHERSFLRMLNRAPADALPPQVSNGLTLFTPADKVQQTLMLRNESFQDHWDYHPWTEEGLKHRIASEPRHEDLWFYASVDGAPAGICINTITEAVDGTLHGHLGPIGTLRDHRGKGVARFLLRTSLQALAREGVQDVALWVDTVNPFQATKLYRDNGFEAHYEWCVYRRDL